MKKYIYTAVVFGLICLVSCNEPKSNVTNSTMANPEIAQKVDSLLSIMTLEEKIGQMNQYNGFWDFTGPEPSDGDNATLKYEHLKQGLVGSMLNVRGVKDVRAVQKIAVEESRLGIPLIIGFDVIHGYKTLSPIPLAESASWDLEAIEASAQVAAREAAASGINWTFAPMLDISRDARWGRVMEGAGEDPYLGSLIGAARVRGFQGSDLTDPLTIAACAKHFAGYGFAESGKDYNTVDVGTSTLYNTIFPPFEAAIEADVKTFMNAFNVVNGVPATGNAWLQRDILKDKWDYSGFVVSDWGSIAEMIPHGFAKDAKDAALKAVTAGSDMDMESYMYVAELANLVNEGKVDEALITDAARRILTLKYELGLFDDPYKYCDEAREASEIGSDQNRAAVLDMAKKSIVLLKNENSLLPLAKSGQKVALIGQLAGDKNSPLGSWRIAAEDDSAVSVLEGMQSYTNNTLTYTKGVQVSVGETAFILETKINETDRTGIDQAVQAARGADVVVMVLGEIGWQSGEARSRTELDLPGLQQEMLEAVYKVNKNIVLVLNNGRPLALPWADENIPAIVEAWQLGTETGNAVAQVLYGDYNPSGKMPMTTPRSVGQVPIYYNHKNTGRPSLPGEDIVFWSHYIDQENSPLYPFGYGLSYTNFDYSDLKVTNNYATNASVTVAVTVTNSGDMDGKEVVQLYLQDPVASVTRAVRELKGFELATILKGESKTIEFTLTKKELGFYNNQGDWLVESGDFNVFVGGDSATTLTKSFSLE